MKEKKRRPGRTKMKSMTENNGGNNWLGFSLSPHMHMESAVTSATVPTSYVMSSSPTPHHGLCSYGGESISINGGCFQYSAADPAPPSMMPLKSDGSLCIMEAFSRSHPQGKIVNRVLLENCSE